MTIKDHERPKKVTNGRKRPRKTTKAHQRPPSFLSVHGWKINLKIVPSFLTKTNDSYKAFLEKLYNFLT